MLDSIRYWLRGQKIQNFGDALSRVYMDRLFLPLGSQASHIHLVGSVIDDMFVEDALKQNTDAKPVFWGCGIRTPHGLSRENKDVAQILAVRGPISAEYLELQGKLPLGDSALLLPAIYKPSSGEHDFTETICIPHFYDARSNDDLLALSNCDVVLRSAIGPDLQDIYDMIDRIASAKFVLSASLHGAIVAAVYGRPFCFWNNGTIDLPLKWEDFAASIGIPCIFSENISQATATYDENIRAKVELPPLLPLALSAPFVIQSDAMANIVSIESRNGEFELEELAFDAPPVLKANRMMLNSILNAQQLLKQNQQLSASIHKLAEEKAAASKQEAHKKSAEIARLSGEAVRKYERLKFLLNNREKDRRGLIKKIIFKWRAIRDEKAIRRAGLFDEAWYRASYPELSAGKNVVRHYLTRGWYEEKNPNPFFVTAWYHAEYPDVLISGSNPLIHFLKKGAREGRDPGPEFSTADYYHKHPELKRARINPLAHFLAKPRAKSEDQSEITSAHISTAEPPRSKSSARPKVVIIDSVYPTPDKDSGSIDAVNFINTFNQLGYEVVFISDSQFYDRTAKSQCLEQLGATIINGTRYQTVDQFVREEGQTVSVFFLSRVHSGGKWLESIFRYSRAKIIFNTVDLHFLREERQARLTKNRSDLNRAAGTRERELAVTRLADATIVVTEAEGEMLRDLVPDANVVVIPLARSAPGAKNAFDDRSDIGFIGGFAHAPNVDAVLHFIKDDWPIIKTKCPTMKFYIYGSEMPDSFFQFTALDVVPVGYVEEVGPVLERHRVMVAPLRYGAGAKGKVVTSLAHGVPCVATGVAAEGMGLTPGHNILMADSSDAFAEAVVTVYSNRELWSTFSERGVETVAERFALKHTVDKLQQLLYELEAPSI